MILLTKFFLTQFFLPKIISDQKYFVKQKLFWIKFGTNIFSTNIFLDQNLLGLNTKLTYQPDIIAKLSPNSSFSLGWLSINFSVHTHPATQPQDK